MIFNARTYGIGQLSFLLSDYSPEFLSENNNVWHFAPSDGGSGSERCRDNHNENHTYTRNSHVSTRTTAGYLHWFRFVLFTLLADRKLL
jgi:hypothetical protein